MKNSHVFLFVQLLVLLSGILAISSCFDIGDNKTAEATRLPGKWQLLRIEDTLKTVVPPTDVIKLEVAFKSNENKTGETIVTGNILSGRFTGKADFNTSDTGGNLDLGPLHVTEDMLLKQYKQFDDYYLQELAQARKFTISKKNLIITSKDKSELVYIRTGE